jgi:chemotaxis protein methyltransferase CheR
VLKRLGIPSYESFLQGLGGPDASLLREQLVEAITTKETSFNRDGHPFEALRRSILPELARRLLDRRAAPGPTHARCRIWCAAVATGQEAYSVAMAVSGFLASRPGLELSLDDFPILATDISARALAIAREGRYSTEEVRRGISEDHRLRDFRRDGDGWIVSEPLRRMVDFRRLNLVRPLPNLGTFDLILCRNLLIYLDDDARRRLCQGLHRALNPSGFLIIGAAESLYGVTDSFSAEQFGKTLVHRKR